MRIRELAAQAWRNLAPLRLAPSERLTVLSGDNGQGKTNVLEAAYYLAAFRSFRTTSVEDLVQHDAAGGRSRLRADIDQAALSRRLELDLAPGARTVRLDGKLVRSTAAALGLLRVVLFVPEDLLLPRSAPSARRRFADLAIFNLERGYYAEASAFQKVLRNRNALLKRGAIEPTLLDTFDEELARTGARVVVRRRALAAVLAPRFAALFRELHGEIPVSLTYRSHEEVEAAGDEAAVRLALARGLTQRRGLDERRRFTGFGPQTDDLEINFAGSLARGQASQGQLRSLMLALKLAELMEIGERLGDPPVLLLDDVPSELDARRRGLLFEVVSRLQCQTLISVTEPELVPAGGDRIDFQVRGGTLTRIG